MKKIVVALLLSLVACVSIAQNVGRQIDSLQERLKITTIDSIKADILNRLATAYWLTGDLNKALNTATDAVTLAQKINYRRGILNGYNEISFINADKGNYPEALKTGFQALDIAEKINNRKGMINTHMNIGNIYFRQKNFSEALANYQSSLKIAQELNDKNAQAHSYNNIGNVFFKQQNYDSALRNNMMAEKISREIDDKNTLALSCLNIGNIYETLKNPKEATANYEASLKIAEEINDKSTIAASYINLGELIVDKLPATAKDYYSKGLSTAKLIGNKEEIAYCYDGLAEADSGLGNFAEAYHYSRLQAVLRDSILDEKSSKQLSQLKVQYETDKKDEQIKADALSNQTLRTQVYLSIALSILVIGIILFLFYLSFLRNRRKKREFEHMLIDLELSVLKAQLNPHFISNSLTNIKTFIDQQPERASHFLAKFARLMRRVLEQNEKQLITLREELQTAELYMQIEAIKTRYGFDYQFNCDPAVDQDLFKVPPLILQPVIENAIWHGLAYKDEKGHITINITLEKDILKFTVEDDGVGQEIKKTSDSVKPAGSKSFGLSITRKRIEVLSKEFKTEGHFNLSFFKGLTIAEIALPAIHL